MSIGAVLTDRFRGQPFGWSAAAALLADAELRCARLARAFQQRRERVEEFVFWQPSPFQHADAARLDGQRMCALRATAENSDTTTLVSVSTTTTSGGSPAMNCSEPSACSCCSTGSESRDER